MRIEIDWKFDTSTFQFIDILSVNLQRNAKEFSVQHVKKLEPLIFTLRKKAEQTENQQLLDTSENRGHKENLLPWKLERYR